MEQRDATTHPTDTHHLTDVTARVADAPETEPPDVDDIEDNIVLGLD